MNEPITLEEWTAMGKKLFGDDRKEWKFVCPVCSAVQTMNDFAEHTEIEKKDIGNYLAFSCIGRWAKGGCEHAGLGPDRVTKGGDKSKPAMGCDYAGGGLFKLNPMRVTSMGKEHQLFAFAEETT